MIFQVRLYLTTVLRDVNVSHLLLHTTISLSVTEYSEALQGLIFPCEIL